MSVNGIEIAVGQKWKTRNGEVCTITGNDGHCEYPWDSTEGSYTRKGTVWTNEQSPYDLFELIKDADGGKQAETKAVSTAYDKLADVLNRALFQASQGKGKERHASGDTPFEEQPMATINRQLGSVHGFVFQAHKKSLEAMRLPAGRDVAELLGAINYLCGAVIALESWAKKD